MTIKFNDQIVTIEDTGKKAYINSRNSWSGKGKYYKIFRDSDGNEFVKFWSQQVAKIEHTGGSYKMVHAFDIVK